MKKVKFYVSTGHVGAKREEIKEYNDDATKEEIEEDFLTWLWEHVDSGWSVIEDKEE